MISFPKKSFYFQSEVTRLLSITDKELRSFCRDGLQSLFSENGKKIFLREDIINLYAKGIVVEKSIEFKVNTQQENSNNTQVLQLKNYRESIEGALSLISQIKSKNPQIWYSH